LLAGLTVTAAAALNARVLHARQSDDDPPLTCKTTIDDTTIDDTTIDDMKL
jgi:hypothetical protein